MQPAYDWESTLVLRPGATQVWGPDHLEVNGAHHEPHFQSPRMVQDCL
jgi:hypothetical protein